MRLKFKGAWQDLNAVLAGAGVKGKWAGEVGQGKLSFRSDDGGVLDWWPSTGSIKVGGSPSGRSELKWALARLDKAPQRKT